MKFEKSCGAVVFRRSNEDSAVEYLIIFNKKGDAAGHWGFPKGHVENNETELMTAKREIFEETGLSPEFVRGFRALSQYSPKEDTQKDAVYFLARDTGEAVTIQKSELADYKWCRAEEAVEILDYDKDILKAADKFLKEHTGK